MNASTMLRRHMLAQDAWSHAGESLKTENPQRVSTCEVVCWPLFGSLPSTNSTMSPLVKRMPLCFRSASVNGTKSWALCSLSVLGL